jgi:glycosyltransferase domain-containing protein
MRDFTLIIPTHDRPQLLSALLGYLETEKAEFHILVLDTSHSDALKSNRARVAASGLDVELAPFADGDRDQNWRQGLQWVSTPLCSFCGDDSLVPLKGLRQCLDALRINPDASAAQGRSFTFLHRPDGDIELHSTSCFSPSIADRSPLERLAKSFAQDQAPRQGVFRTAALPRIFDNLVSVTEVLSRELLWAALTVIEGQAIYLPGFSYGRSIVPLKTCERWHPLEWFCKDPDGLFAEYLRYREIIASAVLQRFDNMQDAAAVRNIIDLIHLRYLVRQAPDSTLELIAKQHIDGTDLADCWTHREMHSLPHGAAGIPAEPGADALGPQKMRGRTRCYHVFPQFYSPLGIQAPGLQPTLHLIDILDKYQPALGMACK